MLKVEIFSTRLGAINVKNWLNWLAVKKSSAMLWLFMFKAIFVIFLEFFMFVRLCCSTFLMSFFVIFEVEFKIVFLIIYGPISVSYTKKSNFCWENENKNSMMLLLLFSGVTRLGLHVLSHGLFMITISAGGYTDTFPVT